MASARPKEVNLVQVLSFEFHVTNEGPHELKGVTGILTFSDVFDRERKRIAITFSTRLAPGQKIIDSNKYYDANPFIVDEQWLLATPLDEMKWKWETKAVVLMDGTIVGTVP